MQKPQMFIVWGRFNQKNLAKQNVAGAQRSAKINFTNTLRQIAAMKFAQYVR